MDPIFWALDLGLPEAVRVDDWGDWDPIKHGATFPKGDRFTIEFPAKNGRGPVKVVWFDGTEYKNLPCPEGLTPSEFAAIGHGGVVYGDKGAIVYGSHGAKELRLLPGKRFEELKAANSLPPQRYPRVPNGSPYNEWIGAVKGELTVGSDFAYAGNITQVALIALAALFDPGKRLEWDTSQRAFKNSVAANARLRVKRLPGYGL